MDLGRKLMRLPQENGVIVYDMADFSLANMDNEFMKFQINVMQVDRYACQAIAQCSSPVHYW
jgi:hypothetical protein